MFGNLFGPTPRQVVFKQQNSVVQLNSNSLRLDELLKKYQSARLDTLFAARDKGLWGAIGNDFSRVGESLSYSMQQCGKSLNEPQDTTEKR
ncbi:hypothetical protein [Limihaloglobus sulfuriphilus]|uniref:hypothetical protein n=1 Tax=Limihaloglobus sulfuriphilus TaxID=1851148 RepID=UPI0011BAC494|nr:hypothetical protein [Limihaloglobus sulfuriphilus]